jgi:mxaD protein
MYKFKLPDALKYFSALFALLTLSSGQLYAHGPSPQRLEESIKLAAEPAAVWALIGDFHQLAQWHPLVESSGGEGSNDTGATRELKLAGGKLVERLDRHKDQAMRYGYRVLHENAQALPVSFYSATLSVRAAGEGSEVLWRGMFYRADTSNYPSEGMNDEAGRKALSDFFRAGLDNLNQLLGSK